MKKNMYFFLFVVLMLSVFVTLVYANDTGFIYKSKHMGHKGKDITPTEAYKMVREQKHVFIVDVRTRPEYALIGHAPMAYHIPLKFWTGNYSGKFFANNPNFLADLKKRFNPKTDTLIFMCRSGHRSCLAANLAVLQAHWPNDTVYNMLGGFEGDAVKDKNSAEHGKRMLGGWKNEGLPWVYDIDAKLAYPDAG